MENQILLARCYRCRQLPCRATKPKTAQLEQCGAVTTGGQPVGTTYGWTVTGPAATGAGGTSANNFIQVYATSGSGSGGIKVRTTFTYTDPTDANFSGSAQDDSEETPPPGTTMTNALYYSFTSHQPHSVEKTHKYTFLGGHIIGGVWPWTDPWTFQDSYDHALYDQNGLEQQGVWVTERFPGAADIIKAWATAYSQAGMSFENAGVNGIFWTSREHGVFDNVDQVGLDNIRANINAQDPSLYGPMILIQQYFAATKDTIEGDYGILVQTWTNTMTPISETHVKN